MSDKNLLIGDTTYPHTQSTFPTELIDQLRFCANALEVINQLMRWQSIQQRCSHFTKKLLNALDVQINFLYSY
jgi:hypothetical protein